MDEYSRCIADARFQRNKSSLLLHSLTVSRFRWSWKTAECGSQASPVVMPSVEWCCVYWNTSDILRTYSDMCIVIFHVRSNSITNSTLTFSNANTLPETINCHSLGLGSSHRIKQRVQFQSFIMNWYELCASFIEDCYSMVFHCLSWRFLVLFYIFQCAGCGACQALGPKRLLQAIQREWTGEMLQKITIEVHQGVTTLCVFMPLCMLSLSNASKTFRNGLAANAKHTFCETKPCKSVQKVAMKCNGRLWGRILQPFKFSDRRWILAPVIANRLFDTKIPIPWSAMIRLILGCQIESQSIYSNDIKIIMIYI